MTVCSSKGKNDKRLSFISISHYQKWMAKTFFQSEDDKRNKASFLKRSSSNSQRRHSSSSSTQKGANEGIILKNEAGKKRGDAGVHLRWDRHLFIGKADVMTDTFPPLESPESGAPFYWPCSGAKNTAAAARRLQMHLTYKIELRVLGQVLVWALAKNELIKSERRRFIGPVCEWATDPWNRNLREWK